MSLKSLVRESVTDRKLMGLPVQEPHGLHYENERDFPPLMKIIAAYLTERQTREKKGVQKEVHV